MTNPLHAFLSHPALLDALAVHDLRHDFSADSIRNARKHLGSGIVTQIIAKDLKDSFDTKDCYDAAIEITALVAASRFTTYEVSLELFFDEGEPLDVDTYCDCSVEYCCVHGCTLIVELISIAQQYVRTGTKDSGSKIPAVINEWLRNLEANSAPIQPKPAPKPQEQQRFLAYCLEHNDASDKDLYFALHSASPTKNGLLKIENCAARADLTNPPKYIGDEDLPICLAYQRHPRNYNHWGGGVIPSGHTGARLLDMALNTGRFYYLCGQKYRGSAQEHLRIVRGPAMTATLEWEALPSGAMRPVICGLPETHHVLVVDPPLYFDPKQAMLGLLQTEQPLELIKLWKDGPELSANIVEQVSAKIGALPGRRVPAPIPVPTEIRPDCPPTPHLAISKQITDLAGLEPELVVGHLSFQYGDSKALAYVMHGPAPSEYSEVRNGVRIVWKRDAAREWELAESLAALDIVPFITLWDRHILNPTLASSFVADDLDGSSALAWLSCLDRPEMQALRDGGWIITLDPSAGLTAYDVSDFLPAIESNTDHGIDWFHFDVSYEVDGTTCSLIPLIAQAIQQNLPSATSPDLPQWIMLMRENPADGFIRMPARAFMEIVDQVRHLFLGREPGPGTMKLDRLAAAGIADSFGLKSSDTTRALVELSRSLKTITGLPQEDVPLSVNATLRPYQIDGFRWLRFLAKHKLSGILADDMGLGKTLQALTHLAAEHAEKPGRPSLVVAPTSVVPNWAAEAAKFTPELKVLVLHGAERLYSFKDIPGADLVITSYPLLQRDIAELAKAPWHCVILDEAQYIKNPKSITTKAACALQAAHRFCLSGTPMENHLGELWSLLHFLMPGFLPAEKTFNSVLRKPIERDRSSDAQRALNRRVSPLILRRTKDQVASDLPPKTELIHHIELTKKQVDLYESVRSVMDKRVRDAIAKQGLGKSQIIVLDALLKLRQICCHPTLLKTPAAQKVTESAKLQFLTDELLPQLLDEGRCILLFSQFTSMLALIQAHLEKSGIRFLKLTGETKDRASLVAEFQSGTVPIFLISLKAGGTGLNLTAADTVIHYDPWWNPAAENQATDRAHRIGQDKPVFVHKLVCRGSIEDRILELQRHKSALVSALLSEETTSLRIDPETLSHLFTPID